MPAGAGVPGAPDGVVKSRDLVARPQRPPRTRRDPGTALDSAEALEAARLYAPVRLRNNINESTANAIAAAHAAANAAPPASLPVYPVDERGEPDYDAPPERLVPMTRRLTVPSGVLGSYDIISRASDPDDVPTDGEGADEDRIERSLLVNAPGGVQPPPSSTYAGPPERTSRVRPSRRGATRDTRCAPLTLEMLAGDAARDAATMLERAMHDARTQTQRLRARERKLGMQPGPPPPGAEAAVGAGTGDGGGDGGRGSGILQPRG